MCLGQKCFVWGSVMLLVWEFLSKVVDELFLEDLNGPDMDLEMVYSSGHKKDQLEAWQIFCCVCLALADFGGGGGWAGGC